MRVLRGTTLAQLHRDWGYGKITECSVNKGFANSWSREGLFVYKAIVAGRNFNILALACICATFVAVDGPLLQRASIVRSSVPDRTVTLTARLVPEIPSYRSGNSLLNSTTGYMTADPDLQAVIADWDFGRLPRAVEGCPGSCSSKILGPALAVDSCSSSRQYLNFSKPLTPEQNATWNFGIGEAPRDKFIFLTSLGVNSGSRESLTLGTTIADSPGNDTCAAYVNKTICYLVSAVAEYPVLVENNTVRFTEPQPYPKIVALANNTALTNETIKEYG